MDMFQLGIETIYSNIAIDSHVLYFLHLRWIAASEGRSLTTLFSAKMTGEEIATRTSRSLSHSIRFPSLLLCPL